MKKILRLLSTGLILSGFSLWLAETIFFLFVHGWHMEAINGYEQFLDEVSSVFLSMGMVLGFVYLILVVKIITIEKEK